MTVREEPRDSLRNTSFVSVNPLVPLPHPLPFREPPAGRPFGSRKGVDGYGVGDKVGCGRGTQGDDDKSPSPKVSGDL